MSDLGIGPWEIFVLLVALVVFFVVQRLSAIRNVARRPGRAVVRQEAPAAPVVPMVNCPACQTANPTTNRFCAVCGASMMPPPVPSPTAPPIICPSCATPNPPTQAFCGQCGTGLKLPSTPTPSTPNPAEDV